MALRTVVVVSLGALTLLASDARAADPERTLFGRPVGPMPNPTPEELEQRRRAFEAHLEAEGLVLEDDVLVPKDRLEAEIEPLYDHDGEWHDPPHYATIFLNFFGGVLSSGTNAAEGEAGCIGAVDVDYPPFEKTEAEAMAIIQVFEAAMAPYAVRIAFQEAPPKHLPYSQVMIGGSPNDIGVQGGALGVSCSSDCGDNWWRDTTFAFSAQSNNATTLGNTALQEAAHAFGLDHIDGAQNIMYPFAGSGTKVWSNSCTPFNDATGGISCTYIHRVFCPDGTSQNDDAELLAFFGPDAPDVNPPEVVITSPEDGLQVEPGTPVMVAADVSDDHEGYGWRLVVDPDEGDPQIVNAYQFQREWKADLPQGAYTIRVEAIDHDRNEGRDEIRLFVGVEPVDPPPEKEGTGTESGGTGDGSGSGSSGTGTAEQTGDDGGTGRGCGCSSGWTGWGSFGLWGLVVVPLARRRRKAHVAG